MKTRILGAEVEFGLQTLRVPMRISSGLITEVTEARATVTVEVEGKQASGRGAIYLSDLWAWPDPNISHSHRDSAMRRLCNHIAEHLPSLCGGEAAHPTELGLRLHEALCHDTTSEVGAVLARTLCGSPFDAALHDAVGQALGLSAFRFYEVPTALPSADRFFPLLPDGGACQAIARLLLQPPRREFDAWYCVNQGDTLEGEIAPWVRDRGYHCFKLKLPGKDVGADAGRTIAVFEGVRAMGVHRPRLSVDTNEGNPDSASVEAYLNQLRGESPEAFAALEYLEQPTSRDIVGHAQDWRRAAGWKPIILDEGLTGMEQLPLAQEQGWSGIAIKTCKGHSFALAAAAWAHAHGLQVALQDLTNSGIAAIHSALVAAHVPTINGIELNSPQYTPAANADWLPRLRGLLEPMDGKHHLPEQIPVGLGSYP